MATLTRNNSNKNPTYKDYVNFLGNYKSGTLRIKRDGDQSSDSGVSVKSLSNSTSSSSINSDVTDNSKSPSCVSFNNYLESAKNKKFNSVKPNFGENIKNEAPRLKKSEIFIEIQPAKSVSEVSKIFEQNNRQEIKASPKISAKINIFERQKSLENNINNNNKPKIAEKPVINKPIEVNSIDFPPPPPEFSSNDNENTFKEDSIDDLPPPPPPEFLAPPPPPPPPINNNKNNSSAPKIQATLKNAPQATFSVSNPNRTAPGELDRNDPMVRKLVYGTLRGLYGAYHDQANYIVGTLPKNMVTQSNGVQNIINQIASNGDLEKLNGRINPKSEMMD